MKTTRDVIFMTDLSRDNASLMSCPSVIFSSDGPDAGNPYCTTSPLFDGLHISLARGLLFMHLNHYLDVSKWKK